MPKQTRWKIKRQMDQAANNCDQAINNLVTSGHPFEAAHPDYYQAFCQITNNLEQIKATIIALRDQI